MASKKTRLKFLGRTQFGQFDTFFYGKGKRVAEFEYDRAAKLYEVRVGKEKDIGKHWYTKQNALLKWRKDKHKLFESRIKAQEYMKKVLTERKKKKLKRVM